MLKSLFLVTLILLVCSSAPINMRLYKHVFTASGIKQIDCVGRDCELIEHIECNFYGYDQHRVPMWQCILNREFNIDTPEMLCTCKDTLALCCGLKFELQDVSNMEDILNKFDRLSPGEKLLFLITTPVVLSIVFVANIFNPQSQTYIVNVATTFIYLPSSLLLQS